MKFSRMFDSLARLVAGLPNGFPSRGSVEGDGAIREAGRDAFVEVGRFAPPEFGAVRDRLEGGGIGFEVECDTTAPDSNVEGMFCERGTVAVLVRREDTATALTIIAEWRAEVGHAERKNA